MRAAAAVVNVANRPTGRGDPGSGFLFWDVNPTPTCLERLETTKLELCKASSEFY